MYSSTVYSTKYYFICKTMGINVFFAYISRIALNFTVHRNEYNSTTKIIYQQLNCKKWVSKHAYFFCTFKNYLESPLEYLLLMKMEKIAHNHELLVYLTSKNCQNSYHKLY